MLLGGQCRPRVARIGSALIWRSRLCSPCVALRRCAGPTWRRSDPHSAGSRGLGHQVATDALVQMEKAMGRDGIETNDRQLACARIQSEEGRNYLKAMAAAANYAWVNRSSMTFLCRQVDSHPILWV